jgi:hypothetical protein
MKDAGATSEPPINRESNGKLVRGSRKINAAQNTHTKMSYSREGIFDWFFPK